MKKTKTSKGQPKTEKDIRFIAVVEDVKKKYKIRSDRQLSGIIGPNEVIISKIKTGEQSVQDNVVENLVSKYNASPEYIYTGNGNTLLDETESHTKPYPKLESIKKHIPFLTVLPFSALAGFLSHFPNELENKNFEKIYLPDYNHCDYVIEVDGDSMYPTFAAKDYLICKRKHTWDFIEFGKAYVISVNGEFLVKRIQPGEEEESVLLISDNETIVKGNPLYPPQNIKKDWIKDLFKVHGSISRNTAIKSLYK